jgi:SAM-dependent methyltransferase
MLGLNIEKIELSLLKKARSLRPEAKGTEELSGALHGPNQTWIGLDPEVLQTPYHELVDICRSLDLRSGQRVVDLGAGYGRLGFVLHHLHPGVKFLGLEFVKERVAEGTRVLRAHQVDGELVEEDLNREGFVVPDAEVFFIYDYGKVPHIRRTLQQIRSGLVVARGRGCQSLIDHEFAYAIRLENIRDERFSIYRF